MSIVATSSVRRQSGMTMIETMITLAVVAPLVIAFSSMMASYSKSATSAHEEIGAVGESQRILRAISAELSTSTTNIGHGLPMNPMLPHSESGSSLYLSNLHYCRSMMGWGPAMNSNHDTRERDGNESWYPEWSSRRFYIYATYEPFDTIEYQKVRTPVGFLASEAIMVDNVLTSWSGQRKITRTPDGKVFLVLRDTTGNSERRVVLGHGAEDLTFHLNQDRHIIVRLTLRVKTSENPNEAPVLRTSQITIKPRSGLN
jgi:prepilin-type N-terminal cleavage/methylation domain-containing protein